MADAVRRVSRYRVRSTPATAMPGEASVVVDVGDVTPGGHSGTAGTGVPRPLVVDRGAGRGPRIVEVVVDGWRFELEVESEARAELRERATRARGDGSRAESSEVRAMIPGRVVSLAVAPGEAVEAGQPLLVLEAMKMQNELSAPRAGTVGRVAVRGEQTVERGDLLLVIE